MFSFKLPQCRFPCGLTSPWSPCCFELVLMQRAEKSSWVGGWRQWKGLTLLGKVNIDVCLRYAMSVRYVTYSLLVMWYSKVTFFRALNLKNDLFPKTKCRFSCIFVVALFWKSFVLEDTRAKLSLMSHIWMFTQHANLASFFALASGKIQRMEEKPFSLGFMIIFGQIVIGVTYTKLHISVFVWPWASGLGCSPVWWVTFFELSAIISRDVPQ